MPQSTSDKKMAATYGVRRFIDSLMPQTSATGGCRGPTRSALQSVEAAAKLCWEWHEADCDSVVGKATGMERGFPNLLSCRGDDIFCAAACVVKNRSAAQAAGLVVLSSHLE